MLRHNQHQQTSSVNRGHLARSGAVAWEQTNKVGQHLLGDAVVLVLDKTEACLARLHLAARQLASLLEDRAHVVFCHAARDVAHVDRHLLSCFLFCCTLSRSGITTTLSSRSSRVLCSGSGLFFGRCRWLFFALPFLLLVHLVLIILILVFVPVLALVALVRVLVLCLAVALHCECPDTETSTTHASFALPCPFTQRH